MTYQQSVAKVQAETAAIRASRLEMERELAALDGGICDVCGSRLVDCKRFGCFAQNHSAWMWEGEVQ